MTLDYRWRKPSRQTLANNSYFKYTNDVVLTDDDIEVVRGLDESLPIDRGKVRQLRSPPRCRDQCCHLVCLSIEFVSADFACQKHPQCHLSHQRRIQQLPTSRYDGARYRQVLYV